MKLNIKYLRLTHYSLISFLYLFITGCGTNLLEIKNSSNQFSAPEWSRNSSIYEVNVRQYSKEGTFKKFAESLPRLKEMGIDILWFMPIHPIGKVNRKGSLGSYYSVQDYKSINPEFGTLEDFKSVVDQAHDLGMYVIIDWVANHTSWDNVWAKANPDFYTKNSSGNFISPYDWTDVIQLDYNNRDLWTAMTNAMKYWVDECGIDGFRCDVAAMVPLEFWKYTRPQLEKNKKLFMLAEAHEPEMHEAFDMTYNWQLKDLFVEIAAGKKNAEHLAQYFERELNEYPTNAYRMTFTTNHDENSWNGTDQERFKNYTECFSVLSCLVNGMPLIYSGMEGGLNKRLKFFDKDTITWVESKYSDLYTKLLHLKKNNKALWNGKYGSKMLSVITGDPNVYSFIRRTNENSVLVIANLSGTIKNLSINDPRIYGKYRSLFDKNYYKIDGVFNISIEPYSYFVLYI
ncbi:MAG: alpha-amylase [Ignavibacteria bacterium]|nr:alpha-amylase [Ignavibacteria bacterium]